MVSVTTIVLILLTILKVINGIEVLDTISVAQRVVNETESLLGIFGNSQEQITEAEIEKVMKSLRSISNLIQTVPKPRQGAIGGSVTLEYLFDCDISYPGWLYVNINEIKKQNKLIFEITNNFTEINRKTLHALSLNRPSHYKTINFSWFFTYDVGSDHLEKRLAHALKNYDCVFGMSAQHVLLDYYNQKLIVLLYAFRLALFNEANSTIFENKVRYVKILDLKQSLEEKLNKIMKTSKNSVQESDLSIWDCKMYAQDQFMQKRGETYEEVTKLLQGVIVNEADLNENRRCRYDVNKYSNGEFKVYGCTKNCDVITQCHNSVQNCEPINSVIEIFREGYSSRRYERLEFNNKIFGRNTTSRSHTVQSFRGEWFSRCDYLFCICDGNFDPQADIHFNLREYKTNISDNMVVTGVRFRKHNHVFHLEIQEGQLENECKINPATVKWIPPHNYEINSTFPIKGIDYHTLTSSDRVISLDDVISDNSSYVVTGVKFSTPFLHLEIHLTEFDIKTGKLDPSNSFWKFNAETSERNEFELNEPDSILMWDQSHTILSDGKNQYIKFRATDYEKDAAQTVVPFIAIEEITAIRALSGVGIFYKGLNGFGLIAPKLLTYDFSKDFTL